MFAKLFETAHIGDLALRNRLVLPPMANNLAEDGGFVGDRSVAYYSTRSGGGVGLVTVEVAAVDPNWMFAAGRHIRVDDDRFIPGLGKLVDAVHAQGAKISLQLGHPGAAGYNPQAHSTRPVGPSEVQFLPHEAIPRQLSIGEIAELVERFARAAKRAQSAGFDAVEVHGAHGYLLSQFLAPGTNRREDEYGGDFRGRARIVVEVVAAIKRECGRSYPVMVRLNGEDEEGGITPVDTALVAGLSEEVGADAISVSYGSRRSHLPKGIAPAYYPEGVILHLAAQVKQAVSIPVIGVGRISTPAFADKALEEGKADFIALGRALIADPEWPNKAASGRQEEIVPCLACNRCSESIGRGDRTLSCTVNPAVGREAEFTIVPALRRKKVVVVGSGPGGMEAARVAALRGHEVTLYEKAAELGGQLVIGGKPPYKGDIERLRSYYVGQMSKCGVRVESNCEFTFQRSKQVRPDAIIVAAGSAPFVPDIPGVHGHNVATAEQVLAGRPVGNRVIVIGGESTGCETAEFLAALGKSVIIMRRGARLATDLQASVRALLLRRLRAAGVVFRTGVQRYEEITDAGLVFVNEGGEREELAADTIVLASGMRQRDGLRRELEGKVAELHAVGDCVEPRDIMAAVREGAIVGRLV